MATKTKKAPAKKAAKAKTKAAATPKRMPANKRNQEPEAPAKKLSQIAAAEQVLAEANVPMTCGAMIEAMTTKGLFAVLLSCSHLVRPNQLVRSGGRSAFGLSARESWAFVPTQPWPKVAGKQAIIARS